jgi:GntR family transcriptional regulator, transcriptional repressor for pyruvate dehydrogenase complex
MADDNLSDYVVRHLVEHIRQNRLQSGAVMPSELRVASELQVSRGIVREAYRSLKMAGILDVSNGRAPRVGHLNNNYFCQTVKHALSTQQVSVEQVLELRSSVEVCAAGFAAARRTEAHVATLMKQVESMHSATRNRERFVKADLQFHQTIGEASGNPLYALLVTSLRQSLEASIRVGLDSRTSYNELHRINETHLKIADAIAAKDSSRAEKYMTAHFEEARAAILKAGTRNPSRAAMRA